jgi:hypothetical protein
MACSRIGGAAAALRQEIKRVGTEEEPRSFFYLRPGAPKEKVSFICFRRGWRRGVRLQQQRAPKEKLLTLDMSRGRLILASLRGLGADCKFRVDTITRIEEVGERGLLIRRTLPRGCCHRGPSREGIVELIFVNPNQRAYFTSLATSCSPSLYAHARLTSANRLPLQARNLKVFVATWNMGNADAPPDLSHLTRDLTRDADRAREARRGKTGNDIRAALATKYSSMSSASSSAGNEGNEGNEGKDTTGEDGGHDGGHDGDDGDDGGADGGADGGVGGYDIAAFGFQESVRSVGPALAACIDLTEWVLLKAEAMGDIRMYVRAGGRGRARLSLSMTSLICIYFALFCLSSQDAPSPSPSPSPSRSPSSFLCRYVYIKRQHVRMVSHVESFTQVCELHYHYL